MQDERPCLRHRLSYAPPPRFVVTSLTRHSTQTPSKELAASRHMLGAGQFGVRILDMRRSTALFILWILLLLAIGWHIGRALAIHPKLETFKLLNILGLTYDMLGLLVLSEMVVTSERLKSFVIFWVAGVVLWAQSVVPLGAAAGAWVGVDGVSSGKAARFFIGLFCYSLLPLAILDHSVFNPKKADASDKTQRNRRFGLFLLVTGVTVQLIAAFQDLYA